MGEMGDAAGYLLLSGWMLTDMVSSGTNEVMPELI